MGRAQAFAFIIPWELVSLYISCVKCWTLFALFASSMWVVDLGVLVFLRKHDIGYYLWLSCLWGEICIGTTFYSHAQGMIVNTKLNPYYVMSLCFANEVLIFISCHIPLWRSLPICVFPFMSNLIDMHTFRGRCYFLHDMIYLFANPSVVI